MSNLSLKDKIYGDSMKFMNPIKFIACMDSPPVSVQPYVYAGTGTDTGTGTGAESTENMTFM